MGRVLVGTLGMPFVWLSITFHVVYICLCEAQIQPPAQHIVYDGHLMLGASIPLRTFSPSFNTTCGVLTLRGLQLFEAFRLALEHVNSALALPFRLGAVLRDDCESPELAFLNTIYFTAPRISSIFQFAPPVPLMQSSRTNPLDATSRASQETLAALFGAVSNAQRDLLAAADSNETSPLQTYSKVIGFISGSSSDTSLAIALFLRLFRMPLVEDKANCYSFSKIISKCHNNI